MYICSSLNSKGTNTRLDNKFKLVKSKSLTGYTDMNSVSSNTWLKGKLRSLHTIHDQEDVEDCRFVYSSWFMLVQFLWTYCKQQSHLRPCSLGLTDLQHTEHTFIYMEDIVSLNVHHSFAGLLKQNQTCMRFNKHSLHSVAQGKYKGIGK